MQEYLNAGAMLSGESPVDNAYDLHPEVSDNKCGYYWIYYELDSETHKEEYRVLTLNEAIGAFLVKHEEMSYSDIIDHFEV